MAAIRDGLGRVRVAGEAIYQRETLLESCFAPDRWWPLPPPFLVLPLFTSPSSTPFSLPPSPPSPPLPSYFSRIFSHSRPWHPLDHDHPLNSAPYSPRVRSRKYKRHWRLMEMDEMRGKRTIEKWWKIEWGRTREKIRRTKELTRTRRCWGERGIGSSPDPYATTVFIFYVKRYSR